MTAGDDTGRPPPPETGSPPTDAGRRGWLGGGGAYERALLALFAVEVVTGWVAYLPHNMNFVYVAFEDLGGSLVVQLALDHGLRPQVDFYYPYGLLPLLVGRAWFGALGRTPWAFQAFVLACDLVMAWGLVRFVKALRVGGAGVVLLAATMPMVVRPTHLNTTHALEAALLCHALAEHARGRRATALALLSACCFVKPTMAYVYGFYLTCVLAYGLATSRAASARDWLRSFGPAALVVAALVPLLAGLYGWESLKEIQFPVRGASSYRYANYGFFRGSGRYFWNPPGVRFTYYLGTHTGFWLAATFVLLAGGVAAAWDVARGAGGDGETRRAREVVLCTLGMHLAFVCFFFGTSWDWRLYAFVLILGVVALTRASRAGAWAAWALLPVALLGYTSDAREVRGLWTESARSPSTAGLWSPPGEREEWERVLALTEGGRPVLLKLSGCGEMLFPRFVGTDSFYLHPNLIAPLMPPAERARIVALLRGAREVVVVKTMSNSYVLDDPDFRDAVAGCRPVLRGERFDVYRREPPAAPARTALPPDPKGTP